MNRIAAPGGLGLALVVLASACGGGATTSAATSRPSAPRDRTSAGGYRLVHAPIVILEGTYPKEDGYGGIYAVLVRLDRALPRTAKHYVHAVLSLDGASSGDPLGAAYRTAKHCYFREILAHGGSTLGGLPLHPLAGARVTVRLQISGVTRALHERVALGRFPPANAGQDKALPAARKLGCT
jgi:hypothetical protein